MKTLIGVLLFAASSFAQMLPVDTLPGTCSIGQTFVLTTATAGLNIYECSGANTLTLIPSNLPASSFVSNSTTGLVPLSVCHATYSKAVDGGGAPGLITPASNCTLPAKSIVYGLIINWTTAGVGVGNTTSIGLTGTGGGAAVLLAATAVASLTGLTPGLVTFAAPLKLTTSGTVTLTTAVAALTAGICEIYVFYVVSPT